MSGWYVSLLSNSSTIRIHIRGGVLSPWDVQQVVLLIVVLLPTVVSAVLVSSISPIHLTMDLFTHFFTRAHLTDLCDMLSKAHEVSKEAHDDDTSQVIQCCLCGFACPVCMLFILIWWLSNIFSIVEISRNNVRWGRKDLGSVPFSFPISPKLNCMLLFSVGEVQCSLVFFAVGQEIFLPLLVIYMPGKCL